MILGWRGTAHRNSRRRPGHSALVFEFTNIDFPNQRGDVLVVSSPGSVLAIAICCRIDGQTLLPGT